MSDTEAASAVVDTVAPVVVEPAKAADDHRDPAWVSARLERERRSWLKQLGVESVDDAKAAFEELKARKGAEQSERDKLNARIAELEPAAKELSEYREAVALQANEALASLTPEQRGVIADLAGDSPAKQLQAIAKLRPTWSQATAVAPAPVKLAPASTAPAAKAPAPSASADESVIETYQRLLSADPEEAASYRIKNWGRYQTALKARA